MKKFATANLTRDNDFFVQPNTPATGQFTLLYYSTGNPATRCTHLEIGLGSIQINIRGTR